MKHNANMKQPYRKHEELRHVSLDRNPFMRYSLDIECFKGGSSFLKEIFLNSAKCAYLSVIQSDALWASGVIAPEFITCVFQDYKNNIPDIAFANILKCLGLEECEPVYEDNEYCRYDFVDTYGRVYNAGNIHAIFGVKHSDEWYEAFWISITEGKEGTDELIKEALADEEKYKEKLDKCRQHFSFDLADI